MEKTPKQKELKYTRQEYEPDKYKSYVLSACGVHNCVDAPRFLCNSVDPGSRGYDDRRRKHIGARSDNRKRHRSARGQL